MIYDLNNDRQGTQHKHINTQQCWLSFHAIQCVSMKEAFQEKQGLRFLFLPFFYISRTVHRCSDYESQVDTGTVLT
jgi:uncharacterized protein YgiB involved in biofilm formation